MSQRFLALTIPAVAMFVMSAVPVATPATAAALWVSPGLVAEQTAGRYKQQKDVCEWDAKDNGPNQCEPIVKGRFKKGPNDSCAWNATDPGADECRPPKGRWKAASDKSCTWDGNDNGPDQCNPRRVK